MLLCDRDELSVLRALASTVQRVQFSTLLVIVMPPTQGGAFWNTIVCVSVFPSVCPMLQLPSL